MKQLLSFVLLVSISFTHAIAQDVPFAKDIHAFKQQDSVTPPPSNAILFVGSSSFTMWKSVQEDFPGYTIINRGFGGSSLPDVIRYADQIIIPYKPKQILIYCGDNDLAASDTVSAATVVQRFQQLFQIIRKKLPKAHIDFVAIKPSPSRARLMPKALEANVKIKEYLSRQKRTAFIDVYHKMLQPDGQPMPDIFLEDNLHMNRKGYAIWIETIRPYLLK